MFKGQCWISYSEPELGLAIIEKIDKRFIYLNYRASEKIRKYSKENAPIKRIIFNIGDRLELVNGQTCVVESVEQSKNLFVYVQNDFKVIETDILSFSGNVQGKLNILEGQLGTFAEFKTRIDILEFQHKQKQMSLRGLTGSRIELLSHQLYLTHEIAGRYSPKVLLSDEVGLGKTVESCLILSHLLNNNRVGRVLIVVPQNLIHQWLFELLMRFNLKFNYYDSKRWESLEEQCENPFEDDELIICSYSFLESNNDAQYNLLNTKWDMFICDEAHHLQWNLGDENRLYKIFKELSYDVENVLLLTATPAKYGQENLFGLLNLLDPERYSNYKNFKHEENKYKLVAEEVEVLLKGKSKKNADKIKEIIDRYGTGRVFFRNTRKTVSLFPKRIARLVSVSKKSTKNVKIIDLLSEYSNDKFLIICSNKNSVLSILKILKKQLDDEIVVFHENLSSIERDRNAVLFSEKNRARIMISSEIGSEGRNFQFVNHLLLADLPENPDQLEQRIGRLDRIGQKKNIFIHIPFCEGTGEEVLARWYHEGINAVEKSSFNGHKYKLKFKKRIRAITKEANMNGCIDDNKLKDLIKNSANYYAHVEKESEKGRNRLLEISSYNTKVAKQIFNNVCKLEQNEETASLFIEILSHYGVTVQEVANKTYKLNATGLGAVRSPKNFGGIIDKSDTRVQLCKEIDGLNEDDVITFSRENALIQENLTYAGGDHPIFNKIMDQFLLSEKGKRSIIAWKNRIKVKKTVAAMFVLICSAPEKLNINRYLPPTPILIFVDDNLTDLSKDFKIDQIQSIIHETFENGPGYGVDESQVYEMIKKCQKIAEKKAGFIRNKSLTSMKQIIQKEIERLIMLRKVNPNVRFDEVKQAEIEKKLLSHYISNSVLNLDSVTIIV